MNEHSAYICLNLISGIGPLRVKRLIECFSSAAAIFEQKYKDLRSVEGIGEKLARQVLKGPELYNPEEEMGLAQQAGVQIISQVCPQYPQLLLNIVDPPLVLYVRGQVGVLQHGNNTLAMVGSRRPTNYGVHMARSLTESAVAAQWITISGLAIGIATVVHHATVEAHSATIAVLGGGWGRLYPQENLELARRICEKGAVISEFPMGYPPDRRSFPMRNRIISGMSCGTLVVEAGLKSGTLITAGQALEQGRAVFAIPGPVDRPHSRGCHSLIRDGAVLVENFGDIINEFNNTSLFDLPLISEIDKKSDSVSRRSLQLSKSEEKILEFLSQGDASVDTIVEELEMAIGMTFATLIEMETKRLVKPLPGKRYTLWS
ncbi:MAG: DNA-protecting protein DprA [Lentisphaeraceae bacterium]|nr:DNA-protecting protein DprA [Lentisphaeraceae bacterium]